MMENLSELKNIKKEPSDSTSSDERKFSTESQMDIVKEESDYSIHSKLDIKTEEQEDVFELPVYANTSYEIYPNYNEEIEDYKAMVKNESKDLLDEITGDPLDQIWSCQIEEVKLTKMEHSYSEELYENFQTSNACCSINVNTLESVAVGNEEYFSTEKVKDTIKYKTEETQEEKCLLTSVDKNGASKNRKQSREKNKGIRTIKKHTCHVCHKIFTRTFTLNRHLRIHTGIKSFKCHICQKTFSVKGNLDTHMIIHSEEKPYACDVCLEVFRYKCTLDLHKLIHSDVKSFSCNVCNKSFRQKQYLNIHKRSHTGDKPYACDLCDKTFTQRVNLNRHIRLHNGEKPYACDICCKSFAQKSNLNNHKQTHKQ